MCIEDAACPLLLSNTDLVQTCLAMLSIVQLAEGLLLRSPDFLQEPAEQKVLCTENAASQECPSVYIRAGPIVHTYAGQNHQNELMESWNLFGTCLT